MRRLAVISLAALAGLVVGGLSMIALQSPAAVLPSPASPTNDQVIEWAPDEPPPGGPAASTGPRRPTPDATPHATPSPLANGDEALLLVWTAGGLPAGLEADVAALPGVRQVTTVAGDLVDLVGSHAADGTPVDDLEDGWAVPFDVLAVDPAGYAAFLPKGDHGTVAELRPGEALLGMTSAALRGLRPGDTIVVGADQRLLVAGLVDDTLVGAAEAVVGRDDAGRLGVDTDRFLLLTHRGERAALEQAMRRLTPRQLRVRAPGETPYLRHGDAVLPQALVKAEFGEFAYRRGPGGIVIEQDPRWVADHLETAQVPILGRVSCHRNILGQLEGALQSLVDRGLAHLVDPEQYAGCHAARLIAPDAGVSRHAWGLAVDLNARDNPYGAPSVQDRRLVETFAEWGFTFGGFWLVPDAMHFEYVGNPAGMPAKVPVP